MKTLRLTRTEIAILVSTVAAFGVGKLTFAIPPVIISSMVAGLAKDL